LDILTQHSQELAQKVPDPLSGQVHMGLGAQDYLSLAPYGLPHTQTGQKS